MIFENKNQLYARLHNGIEMPLLGLGVYDMYGEAARQATAWALDIGYRLIDTAAMYDNEREIGQAIREASIPRSEIFLTTKVNNTEQGYDQTLRAFEASCQRLGLDYIDLYLIHWPLRQTRRATWQALERLYTEGVVRAIGVANYLEPFLDEMAEYQNLLPMVNQVEFSPYLYLKNLLHYCQSREILLQAYTPLVRGLRFDDEKLKRIATFYDKTPPQIILRWALQKGVSTIPKSANKKRLQENFAVFDFIISPQDMALLDAFDEGLRIVDDPMLYF
jgi:diketogulonate reductase-like aldo/keto reductase